MKFSFPITGRSKMKGYMSRGPIARLTLLRRWPPSTHCVCGASQNNISRDLRLVALAIAIPIEVARTNVDLTFRRGLLFHGPQVARNTLNRSILCQFAILVVG
jgi:hypothetical protein